MKLALFQKVIFSIVFTIFLQQSANHHIIANDSLVFWHQDVPLKVNPFVWHLLLNHLPTKDNSIKRWVILATSQTCVGGCGTLEDMTHLFLHCDYNCQVWITVYDWFDFVVVNSYHTSVHLTQFGALEGFSKYNRDVIQLKVI